MPRLHIDFETRSLLDLKKTGVHAYAESKYTDIWCMSWAFDDGTVLLWSEGDELPAQVAAHIEAGGTLVAHNAAFEYQIWNAICVPRHGWPALNLEQLDCTMARALSMSLPPALAQCADALSLTQRKDREGHLLMLRMARPRSIDRATREPVFWDDQGKRDRLGAYCVTDTDVERELDGPVMPLTASERRLWLLDQRINNRGINVDQHAVMQLLRVSEIVKFKLNGAMWKRTRGEVRTVNDVKGMKAYAARHGIVLESLDKNGVSDALSGPLPPHLRDMLLLRQDGAKSSAAKYQSLLDGVCSDGRLRGLFQYHGASTGRWAGRRVQLHNLPRPSSAQQVINDTFDLIHGGAKDLAEGDPTGMMGLVSDCLRCVFIASPGRTLCGVDYSAIEARALAWLAGEETVLEVFRGDGKIYEAQAAGIYNTKAEVVTERQRFVGKVSVLSLGYQGGERAFLGMAKSYGVTDLTAEFAKDIKDTWRRKNPAIVALWSLYENAAHKAVSDRGKQVVVKTTYCKIIFFASRDYLFVRLPSGRAMTYPFPEIKDVKAPWGDMREQVTCMGLSSITRQWREQTLFGGRWAENITSGVARDILSGAMLNLDEAGFDIVLHVHDEIVTDVPLTWDGALESMTELMIAVPDWARGLPVAAKGWTGERYRKD